MVVVLQYRYGAFRTPPGVNTAIHVSPSCHAILDDGQISPRAIRGSKLEGLGGMHDVSISAYMDLESAMSTLLFLYRIWQVAHNELPLERLYEMEPDIRNSDYANNEIYRSYRPNELVQRLCQIVGKERCHYPLVMSSEWAYGAQRDDFCAIEFVITEQHLFTGYNYSYGKDNNLPFDSNPGFELAKQFAVPRESRFFSGDNSVWDFYNVVKSALLRGESSFDPYDIQDHRSPRTLEQCIDEARFSFFGRQRWDFRSYTELLQYSLNDDATRFQFKDFSIDFRPKLFDIDDVYEYYLPEREFRFFVPITEDRFVRVITVEDVIKLATQRRVERGGPPVEPLFLHPRLIASEFILEI